MGKTNYNNRAKKVCTISILKNLIVNLKIPHSQNFKTTLKKYVTYIYLIASQFKMSTLMLDTVEAQPNTVGGLYRLTPV